EVRVALRRQGRIHEPAGAEVDEGRDGLQRPCLAPVAVDVYRDGHAVTDGSAARLDLGQGDLVELEVGETALERVLADPRSYGAVGVAHQAGVEGNGARVRGRTVGEEAVKWHAFAFGPQVPQRHVDARDSVHGDPVASEEVEPLLRSQVPRRDVGHYRALEQRSDHPVDDGLGGVGDEVAEALTPADVAPVVLEPHQRQLQLVPGGGTDTLALAAVDERDIY